MARSDNPLARLAKDPPTVLQILLDGFAVILVAVGVLILATAGWKAATAATVVALFLLAVARRTLPALWELPSFLFLLAAVVAAAWTS